MPFLIRHKWRFALGFLVFAAVSYLISRLILKDPPHSEGGGRY